MAKNDITGDEIATKAVNDLYRDGFDRIFGKNRILRFETGGFRIFRWTARCAEQQMTD